MTYLTQKSNEEDNNNNRRRSSSSSSDKAFQRKQAPSSDPDEGTRFKIDLAKVLSAMSLEGDEFEGVEDSDEFAIKATDICASTWKLKDDMSEIAFQGLLLVLEHCLSHELFHHASFAHFVSVLGFHTVFFWKKAVPVIYDSDLSYNTKYRDALLFHLTLYDVNTGQNRLRELYAAVPGLRNSLLGKHAKRFEEKFHHIVQRRTNSICGDSAKSSRSSLADPNEMMNLDDLDTELAEIDSGMQSPNGSSTGHPRTFSEHSAATGKLADLSEEHEENSEDEDNGTEFTAPSATDLLGMEPPDTIMGSGLASGHFSERVINVSNAPPFALGRDEAGDWEIKQGSGGLVSCVDPAMRKDLDNVWLANLGSDVPILSSRSGSRRSSFSGRPPELTPTTNSLGLPLIKKATTEVMLNVLEDAEDEDDMRADVKDQISLLSVLRQYNKENYKLNPVLVDKSDYNTYYGGISNGLLWPAFHNLPEYIVKDYDDQTVLRDHWHAYVRVNYQFALNAVRNSRPQDFIWIHDYHLLLTGMIMQSLDPHLEVGFFLHIPFLPPDDFFVKFKLVAMAILRGLMRFTKVGFQTHRDRSMFLELVKTHLPTTKIRFEAKVDIYSASFDGWTCSLGVFPVSIKNEEFLKFVHDPEIITQAQTLRNEVQEISLPGGKIFFSVERFDYTKGIKEKLMAWRRYLEKYPDRWGRDVLIQVAVINRRSVETYKQYQDEVLQYAEDINRDFKEKCTEAPEWIPLIFKTDGLPRAQVVMHYLAMDVGVVTPKKDGMNLVAKEMLICNPRAALLISSGAGTEQQLSSAGFHSDDNICYHRLNDVYDTEEYADTFYSAAIEDCDEAAVNSAKLNQFLMANDIEKWSSAFLDPSWTHEVIRPTDIVTLDDLYNMMMLTRNVRRQIVERVIKGIHIRPHFTISLKNAMDSLVQSCVPGSTTLVLKALDDPTAKQSARLDVKDEIEELKKDLAFVEFVQSEDPDNIEQFLLTLEKYHPESADKFHEEISEAITLLTKGDHFHHFFTDRDGTLKSYSCSYPASIQPAYSGVIQSTFARRCAQTCAILTSAPLMHIGILDVHTMPEGHYFYGASGGREWFIDPTKKFKDNSINDHDLAMLDDVFERIEELLEQPRYHHFTWVGSGLQKHYGHITVAKQDCYGSVDETQAAMWFDTICRLVQQVDPSANTLHVRETETDIKIMLKAKLSGRIFNKGHGIHLLVQQLELDLSSGNLLVCGDSETDIPMLETCLAANPADVHTIWVTVSEELKQKVTKLCETYSNSNYAFVSCPEVLLGAMAQATIREIKVRPREDTASSEGEGLAVSRSRFAA